MTRSIYILIQVMKLCNLSTSVEKSHGLQDVEWSEFSEHSGKKKMIHFSFIFSYVRIHTAKPCYPNGRLNVNDKFQNILSKPLDLKGSQAINMDRLTNWWMVKCMLSMLEIIKSWYLLSLKMSWYVPWLNERKTLHFSQNFYTQSNGLKNNYSVIFYAA